MALRILIVDDDANVLAACRRTLGREFDIVAAQGSREATALLEREGPFAVVLSDLRMPHQDGLSFLAHVRERVPEAVRIMLTGYADTQAAITAINEGNIFRFLTKPIRSEHLGAALRAALNQHRLITSERELLQSTLHGSLQVLTDILGIVSPVAFSRSSRLKRYVRHMGWTLNLPDLWQFEAAAMLSQIGCITLHPHVLEKIHQGHPLRPDEMEAYRNTAEVARGLIAKIPRLDPVAEMVAGQGKPFAETPCPQDIKQRPPALLGAQLLKTALELDSRLARGMNAAAALVDMHTRPDECDPQLVTALQSLDVHDQGGNALAVQAKDLITGMVLVEDVRARDGLLLVSKGQDVTPAVLERLHNFAQGTGVAEPILVHLNR